MIIKKILFFVIILIFKIILASSDDSDKNEEDIKKNFEKSIINFKYDYCDINQSRLAVFIIEEIRKFIIKNNEGLINKVNTSSEENTKDKNCLIMNEKLIEYVNHFDEIEEINKSLYGVFKCDKCHKKFKSKEFLFLHYKIFHLANENYVISVSTDFIDIIDNPQYKHICPSDLCIILNCKRYKTFLNLSKDETNIMKYKNFECNTSLENFYKRYCMRLIENCFLKEDDYFDFFRIFCESNRCDNDKYNNDEDINILFKTNRTNEKISILKKQYNSFSELPKENSVFYIFYNIFIYLVTLLAFIYILIIWISRNN